MRLPEFGKPYEKEPKVEKTVPVVCTTLTESMGVTQLFHLRESDRKEFAKQLASPVVKLIVQPENHYISLLADQATERRLITQRQKLLLKFPSNSLSQTRLTPAENGHHRALENLMKLSFQQVLQTLASESQKRVKEGSPVRENLVRTFRLLLIDRVLNAQLASEPIQTINGFPFPRVQLTEDMMSYVKALHSATYR